MTKNIRESADTAALALRDFVAKTDTYLATLTQGDLDNHQVNQELLRQMGRAARYADELTQLTRMFDV